LAATGVDDLAVTEWDKLTDADQALLGLLNFNLGEIAQRLRKIGCMTILAGGMCRMCELDTPDAPPKNPFAILG